MNRMRRAMMLGLLGGSTKTPLVSDGFSQDLLSDGLGHFIGPQNGGRGKIWTVRNGEWAVSSGKLTCSSVGENTARITVDAGNKDYVAEANLYAYGNGFGFLLRYVDESNYIRAWIDYPNVQIQTVVGGSVTSLLNQAITYYDGQKIRFTVNGDKIDAWYGGTLSPTTGGNGGAVGAQLTITDAVLLSSTKVGIVSSNTGNTFDNFSVWPISVWNTIHRPGGVLFTFDDEFDGAVSKIPYAYGKIHGTMYVCTDNVGDEGYGSVAELLDMRTNGILMANHTKTHTVLTTLTEAQQAEEMLLAKNQLIAWGLTGGENHLAFPGGASDANTQLAMTSTGMLTGRTTATGLVQNQFITPSRAYTSYTNFPCVLQCVSTTTLEDIQTVVNRARYSNSYVTLLIHDIKDSPVGVNEMATSVFNAAVDWIVSEGIDAPNIDELYRWCQ